MGLAVWSRFHYQLMTNISKNGGLTTLCCLFQHTLSTLQDKTTALMYAARGGHTDVVQVLLSRQDVDIDMRDEVTILHMSLHVHVAVDKLP